MAQRHLSDTTSLCPECRALLQAEIFEENNKVFISRDCKRHGRATELYWGNAKMFQKAASFAADGKGIHNPNIKKAKVSCPHDCGLCKEHKSQTALANIVVTNRCDLNCWYCFFFAQKAGYVFEPTMAQLKQMVRNLKAEKPIGCNAIQLTGGEPTLRPDLVEIVKMIRQEGIEHIQLNTDGIRLALDPRLAKELAAAGIGTLYLSFDGTSAKTNPKNHWEIPSILENCRKAGLGIVLVPTIVNSVNDTEAGNIVRFAFENIDVVRGVNFQPVSLVGRMPRKERERFRITIPDLIEKLEQQTDGQISREDFFPVPSVVPVSRFVEALTKKPQYELSTHFACGMATYVFKEGKEILPITRFLDVEGFIEHLKDSAEALKKGKSKLLVGVKFLHKINSFIEKDKAPTDLNIAKILLDIFLKRDYRALGTLHEKTLFIGMMHFMDLYNYDVERVKRCEVHYATPDPKMPIVPFCAFNVLPELYRDKIQKKFGLPIGEWEKKNARKLSSDLYKRDLSRLPILPKEFAKKEEPAIEELASLSASLKK